MISRKKVIAIILCTAGMGICAQRAKRHGPVIRQVDHILIQSGDPETLFKFFTEKLRLPTAWPIAGNGGFTSGGAGAGNVNLEVFRYADPKENSSQGAARALFSGLAFEPYPLADALAEMKASGIHFNAPETQQSVLPDGSRGPASTTVTLPSFSNAGFSIFLYEYSPLFLNVQVRREQLGNRLVLNGGGPLGVQSVSEIVIATADLEKGTAEWSRLLGRPESAGIWKMRAGPAIRLVQGRDAGNRIKEISFKVKSLERAEAFLRKNDLRGPSSSDEVFLNPEKIQHLSIGLTDGSSPGTSR